MDTGPSLSCTGGFFHEPATASTHCLFCTAGSSSATSPQRLGRFQPMAADQCGHGTRSWTGINTYLVSERSCNLSLSLFVCLLPQGLSLCIYLHLPVLSLSLFFSLAPSILYLPVVFYSVDNGQPTRENHLAGRRCMQRGDSDWAGRCPLHHPWTVDSRHRTPHLSSKLETKENPP